MTDTTPTSGNPLADVPNDICVEIFSWVILNGVMDQDTVHPLSTPDSPYPRHLAHLTLSHVCAAWRTVTLSRPELWCHVVISPWMKSPDKLFDLVLSRSGESFPLYIWIDGTQIASLQPGGSLVRPLRALRALAPRWTSITFHTSNESWQTFTSVFQITQTSQPSLLEHVKIAAPWVDSTNQDMVTNTKAYLAQFLTSPHILNVKIACHPGPPDIDFTIQHSPILFPDLSNAQNITRIFIGYQKMRNIQTAFDSFAQVPNLEELVLWHCIFTADKQNTDKPRLTLSGLRSLKVVGYDQYPSTIFRRLLLPSLAVLDVRPCRDPQNVYYLLVKSKCQLRRFRLQIGRVGYRNLLHTMFSSRALCNLEDFTLESGLGEEASLNGPLVDFLIKTPAMMALKHMTLLGCVSLVDGQLAALARARVVQGSVNHLGVAVRGSEDQYLQDVQVLKQLRDEGFDMDLSFVCSITTY